MGLSRRDFLKGSVLSSVSFLTGLRCGCSSNKKRLIVLGIDGMDPVLLYKYMKKGSMPFSKRLISSGFEDIEISSVPQIWRLRSVDEMFEAIETGSVRAAATLQGQDAQAVSDIKEAVAEMIERFRSGDRYEIPMPAVLYSAAKPSEQR